MTKSERTKIVKNLRKGDKMKIAQEIFKTDNTRTLKQTQTRVYHVMQGKMMDEDIFIVAAKIIADRRKKMNTVKKTLSKK